MSAAATGRTRGPCRRRILHGPFGSASQGGRAPARSPSACVLARDLETQQRHFESAVVERVELGGAHAELVAERAVAHEHGCAPTGEAGAQPLAQGGVEADDLGRRALKALAVGRVGDDEAGRRADFGGRGVAWGGTRRGGRCRGGSWRRERRQLPPHDLHHAPEPGPLHVCLRQPYGARVVVVADEELPAAGPCASGAQPGQPGCAPLARLGHQVIPERRVVSLPARRSRSGRPSRAGVRARCRPP